MDNLNTEENFRNFIDQNQICSRTDFGKRFSKEYQCFSKLDIEIKDKLLSSKRCKKYCDYITPHTEEEIAEFIKKYNIKSRTEFNNNFQSAYINFRKLPKLVQDNLVPIDKFDYSNINSFDEIQLFINDHKIKDKKEFKLKYSALYMKSLKILGKEEYRKLNFPEKTNYTYYNGKYRTLPEFQKFIDDNQILRPTDFRNNFPKLYTRLTKLFTQEDLKQLNYKDRKNSYSHINTIPEFQKFINENRVYGRNDLWKRFRGLHTKFQKDLDKVTFISSSRSQGERLISDILNKAEIKFEIEKYFDDLKDIAYLRYDFYLPEYNILIEHHGKQHFREISEGKTFFNYAEICSHDQQKFNYAKERNINIIYFTIYKRDYKKYGYFTDVITDPKVLIDEIKRIGLTTQSNNNS